MSYVCLPTLECIAQLVALLISISEICGSSFWVKNRSFFSIDSSSGWEKLATMPFSKVWGKVLPLFLDFGGFSQIS